MLTECAGCGEPIPEGEEGTIWCDHPLGMCVLKTHKTQECGRLALAKNPEHKMRKNNQPPISKKERTMREAKGGGHGDHSHQIPRG